MNKTEWLKFIEDKLAEKIKEVIEKKETSDLFNANTHHMTLLEGNREIAIVVHKFFNELRIIRD